MTLTGQHIKWVVLESLKDLKSIGDNMNSKINSIYRLNDSKRVVQGDILKNIDIPIFNDELEFIKLKFGVILSQDCDLNQDYESRTKISNNDNPSINNKIIPSILICPAYPAEQLRQGNHLNTINMPMVKISGSKKTPWKKIIQNETPRYHYLKKSEKFEIPELVLDFKRYYSISREYLFNLSEKIFNFFK